LSISFLCRECLNLLKATVIFLTCIKNQSAEDHN
jgi:hypothetical protein